MSNAVVLEGVTRHFAGVTRPAVDRVSLDVRPGEMLALLGPSGAGKTTLLRMIAGFERPDSGRIFMGARAICDGHLEVPTERRELGFVFQHGALFPHLTVRQNIAFGLSHLSRDQKAARIAEMASLCALGQLLERYEHELSGGERQRAALARALARGNKLILLDEPMSNVDRPLRMGIGAELRGILSRAGATSVLVTHDHDEALGLADRVAVLHAGCLEQVDTPERIRSSPASAFVAGFLATRGSPAMVPGALVP